MNLEDFLRAFLRTPERTNVTDGIAFLKTCLGDQKHHDMLVAWLAAASREPFLPSAATMLLQALVEEFPPRVLPGAECAVNIVGTGGGLPTFNISTAAAFVAATCQVPVVKTGSHAYSGRCGALDVQDRLGVLLNCSAQALSERLQEHKLVFVPQSHYSPRVRTLVARLAPMPIKVVGRLLNLIGPLLSPYRVAAQVTGVADVAMMETYAEFVRANAATPMWILHALCGMDELCSLSENRVIAVGGAPDIVAIYPEALKCHLNADTRANTSSLSGSCSADEAALKIEQILAGKGDLVQTQTVALNAAAVIHLGGASVSFEVAYRCALDALADGAPARLLAGLRAAIRREQSLRVFVPESQGSL
jgi:anthranilate phosphoribosyltransferase